MGRTIPDSPNSRTVVMFWLSPTIQTSRNWPLWMVENVAPMVGMLCTVLCTWIVRP